MLRKIESKRQVQNHNVKAGVRHYVNKTSLQSHLFLHEHVKSLRSNPKKSTESIGTLELL